MQGSGELTFCPQEDPLPSGLWLFLAVVPVLLGAQCCMTHFHVAAHCRGYTGTAASFSREIIGNIRGILFLERATRWSKMIPGAPVFDISLFLSKNINKKSYWRPPVNVEKPAMECQENHKAEFQSAAGIWNFREVCAKVKGTLSKQKSFMISPGNASQHHLCSKGAVLRQKSVLHSTTHNFHLQPKQKLGQVSHLLVCDFTYSLGPCSCLFSCVGMHVVVLMAVLCVCYWPLVFQRPLVRNPVLEKQLRVSPPATSSSGCPMACSEPWGWC